MIANILKIKLLVMFQLNNQGGITINKLKVLFYSLLEKGAFHIFIGNFANKFVGLCGSIFIVRFLTKEEYGTLGYVENLFSYASIFAGLGLSLALLRYNVVTENKKKHYSNFDFVIKKATTIDIIIVLLIIILSMLINIPKEYNNARILLIILAVVLPFQDISATCLSHERAMLENKRYIRFSIGISFASITCRVIGSLVGGVFGTIICKTLSESFAAILILCSVYKKYFKGEQKDKLSKEEKKEISWYSFHNMIANGIWILFMITDIFLIGQLGKDPEMLADYKVAYMFPSNMAIITSSITVFIGPYFVKNEQDNKWVMNSYKKALLINSLCVGSFALFIGIFAKPIITIIYGVKYINVIPLMRWLLLAFFINTGIKTLTAGLLSVMGKAKENMFISMVGFVVQVTMALHVIPKYGTVGLAKGCVIVYSFVALCTVIAFLYSFGYKRKSEVDESV